MTGKEGITGTIWFTAIESITLTLQNLCQFRKYAYYMFCCSFSECIGKFPPKFSYPPHSQILGPFLLKNNFIVSVLEVKYLDVEKIIEIFYKNGI